MSQHVDTFGLSEFFCENLHTIEQVGPCRRLLFTIHQTEGDRRFPVGVVKLVLPAEALLHVAQMITAGTQVPQLASFQPMSRAN
jgi:hypothetical protein